MRDETRPSLSPWHLSGDNILMTFSTFSLEFFPGSFRPFFDFFVNFVSLVTLVYLVGCLMTLTMMFVLCRLSHSQ